MTTAHGVPVHNARVAPLLKDRYAPDDVSAVAGLLREFGVLDLHPKGNGLYAAVARQSESNTYTGYQHTWLRDTVHLASAAWDAGRTGSVGRTATALVRWLTAQGERFEDCIAGRADLDDPMQRPHVRFDGDTFEELEVWWPHAQNDALGYTLWFLARAALSGLLTVDEATATVLSRFPRYFRAVGYWQDRDSGHWEEQRKLCSSSVGTVVAGLRSLGGLIHSRERRATGTGASLAGGDDLRDLEEAGLAMLADTLPHECRTGGPERVRDADAALLFLIHPLRVVDADMAGRILDLVEARLVGPHGVRRYVGDSYWMADYTRLFDEETRTTGFKNPDDRDAHLRPGTEAQWCLFDPVLSTIRGWRYVATRDEAERERQVLHFNRALGQITGDGASPGAGLCPEAYFLEDSARPERWVANDNTPLLWTQAMLTGALLAMERTAGICA